MVEQPISAQMRAVANTWKYKLNFLKLTTSVEVCCALQKL